MSGMTLNDLLEQARQEAGPRALPGELANLLTDFVLELPEDEARALLLPAVFAWVHAAERSRRRHERNTAAASAVARAPGPPVAGDSPVQATARRFLEATCEVPGHGRVPWGKMTAEFHRLHNTLLEGRIATFTAVVREEVRRHEFAIGLLDESGCADLEEYMDEYGQLPATLTEVVPALSA